MTRVLVDEASDLITRVQAGDRQALEILLERHLPGLRGYVRLNSGRLLRAREASTDLVQSVCREILLHMERFQHPSEDGFRKWLYVTAMRKIKDRYQYYFAEKRDVGMEVPIASPGGAGAEEGLLSCYVSFCTPSAECSAREEIERIELAFDALSEADRDLILLARVVGLSRAAIGERIGVSEGAVRTRLSRALARLAEILDEE
jgi:RNA polymerase sigma-70 factor (ECF subfamily)